MSIEKLTRVVSKPILKTRIVKDKDGNEIEQEYIVIEQITETLSDEEESNQIAEWAKNTEEAEKIKYLQDRKREYPPIEKQLEYMQENGFEDWKQMIQEIKDRYPKPT